MNCYVKAMKKSPLHLIPTDFMKILSVQQDHCGSHNNFMKFFWKIILFMVFAYLLKSNDSKPQKILFQKARVRPQPHSFSIHRWVSHFSTTGVVGSRNQNATDSIKQHNFLCEARTDLLDTNINALWDPEVENS